MTNTLQIASLDQLASIVNGTTIKTPKIAVPNTTITNRAQVTDFANDLQPRFGVDRFTTHIIGNVPAEIGPNGEAIWKPINDTHDACRFGGIWSNSQIDGNGNRPHTTSLGSFLEIVFMGTGLDLLVLTNAASTPPDLRVSVDGGAEGGNIWVSGATNPLSSKNTNANQILPVVAGLAYGLHTVKIRQVNAPSWSWGVYGYDVLNESTSIRTSPGVAYAGGKELRLAAMSTQSYGSGFTIGTLGTRGGRVVIYLQDGTLKKAVMPTDAAQANLALATHANEEVVRKYNFREFGSGNGNDFSFQSGAAQSDRVGQIDDGHTTLIGQNCTADSIRGGEDNVWCTGGGSRFFQINFVGTGLDIVASSDGSTRQFTSVLVDGVSIGALSITVNGYAVYKVVSGLPFGSHTIKFVGDPGGASPGIKDFLIYAPKKPTLPTDTVEVGDYFLTANFVANATAGQETIATGVIRKSARKEMNYIVGAWVTGNNTPSPSGYEMNINTINAQFSHVFFGTGFDLRFSVGANRSNSVQVNINGVNANTTNFPSLVASVYGGAAFNTGTGVLNQNGASQDGAGCRISGLPLAHYKVEFINGTTNFIINNCMDIITPVFSYKEVVGTAVQAVLDVGSCAIGSTGRKIFEQYPVPASAVAKGTVSDPTSVITSYGPVPDMICTIKTKGRPILVTYSSVFRHSAAVTSGYAQIVVDGRLHGSVQFYSSPNSNYAQTLSGQYIVPVGPGHHTVQVVFRTDSGTLFADGVNREMTVMEMS